MKKNFILSSFLLISCISVNAGTSYSIASGNWNSSSTWLFGIIPGSGDDAVIANANTVTVTANVSCNSVTIGNGILSTTTAVTVNPGVTLNVSGSIIIVAPLLGATDNSLNVNAGIVTCTSVSSNNSLSDNKRCVVNITTGTLTCSGSFIMANNTTRNKLIFSGTGVLQIGGSLSTILDAQFTASTGTVEYTSSSVQPILVLTYSTLKCSGSGTKSLTSNLQAKNLIVNSGSTLNIAVGNTLSVSDAFTNNNNITGAGTVQLNGTSAQTIDGNGTMVNLKLNNSNGATIVNNSGNMVNITGKYTPTAGVLTTNTKITFKSNSSGSAVIATGASSGNYISGKAIIERYIPSRRAWRLVSFPITATGSPNINEALQEGAGGTSSNPNPGYGTHITGGSVANGFDQNPVNNPSLKELVSGAWQSVTTTNQAITNQSIYLIFIRGSRATNLSQLTTATADNTTLRITGNVKQGNQTIAVAGTGWQPVPNPFPSVISLNSIATANSSIMNNNFSFWDPKMGGTNNVGAFVTASYNGSSYDLVPTPTSSLSEYAQPFSVFFIDAIATGNLSITESVKCNCGNDNVFRPLDNGTQAKLGINLHSVNTDGSIPVVDGVFTAFSEKFSNDIDKYDPVKNKNIGSENLSIERNNIKLAIERRNIIEAADTIQLTLNNVRFRNYQLRLIPENFDDSVTAFIEDAYTNTKTPLSLSANTIIDFTISNDPASYVSNRFKIVFERLKPTVLPVTFSGIKAAVQKINNKNAIQVEWTVESQLNINKYEAERSVNGIDFIKLCEIAASNEINSAAYNFTDRNPAASVNYYRIKAIENNNKTQYSSIVKALTGKFDKGIQLYQNPISNNTLKLNITAQAKGKFSITLVDEKGKQVVVSFFNHNGEDGIKSVKLTGYVAKGIYNAIIKNADGNTTPLKVFIE